MQKYLKKINHKILKLSRNKNSHLILFIWSCAESSFFPIPPDLPLIAIILADKKKALYLASLTTIASVIGGIIGYAIGKYLFLPIAMPIIEFYQLQNSFDKILQTYQDNGALIVFIGGFTPIPYKIVAIASGVAKISLTSFILFSALSRAARFFLIAIITAAMGKYARHWLEKYFFLLTIGLAIIVLAFWLAVVSILNLI